MWLLALMACTGGSTTGPLLEPPVPTPPATPVPGFEVVDLDTRDGVALVADLWTTGEAGPGIVLLHMTPAGGFNRTDWPEAFVADLGAAGFNVLALDRRGSGDSDGVGNDAFMGEGGAWDVEAAVLELDGRGFGPIGLIGASNGTTSALDYAILAPGEGLPEPYAIGFMTGGGYTENQNSMDDLTLPSVFTFSTAERGWSANQMPRDPGGWMFHEYPTGDHGTLMFSAAPEVRADLVTFFSEAL